MSLFEEALTLIPRYAEDDNAPKVSATTAQVKPEEITHPDVKIDETHEQDDQNAEGDEQMYNNGDQDADDDIDFNLGNGNEYNSPPAQAQTQDHHPIGIKEDG